MLGVKFGREKIDGGSEQSVGWAALALPGPVSSGEMKFDGPLSPERAAMEVVLNFRKQTIGIPHEEWPEVELYRYSKKSWPRSVAASEGGTHENHEKLVKAVADALRDEGATVVFKRV